MEHLKQIVIHQLSTILLLALICPLYSQNIQQKVDYQIQATLDDKNHRLECFWQIEYYNNSTDTLRELFIHLWPNAYRSQETEFAKQVLQNKQKDFYYSVKSERGMIEGLAFKAENVSLETIFSQNDEVAQIKLARPLLPSEHVTITTPFSLKIPKSFSRLGHVASSYQLTQWYPKPAVYGYDDVTKMNKWFTMPYLDQGEFYSEFGTYDVKISLPQNYRVGATGVLQNKEEQLWIDSIAIATAKLDSFPSSRKYPKSATVFKTLQYKAYDVHDFAIFADKRFYILKDTALLSNGNQIDCYAYFTNQEAELWKQGAEYVKNAVQFYSEKVGNYPYPHATAVQSALSAGAGMEYPMITVIGLSDNASTLERVIVHEVGHNWFYGILASNERENPWMDEGINTYFENRYFEERGKSEEVSDYVNLGPLNNLIFGKKGERIGLPELGYQALSRTNNDQSCGLHAAEFTNMNYGIITYMKTGAAMKYLASYLGQKKFDAIMQKYFLKYKFKHPNPTDLRNIFESESGMDLSWFFEDLIKTKKKLDYILWKVDKKAKSIGDSQYDLATVFNFQENIAGPFTISAFKDNKEVKKLWYEGFHGIDTLLFPAADADYYRIDADHKMIEHNRKNNTYKSSGLLKKIEPFKLKLFGALENPYRTQLNVLPTIGYNKYDEWMPGITLYSNVFPAQKFDFTISPMFSVKNKELVGLAHAGYNIYPNGTKLHKVRIYIQGQRFNHSFVTDRMNDTLYRKIISELPYHYMRIAPGIRMEFKKNMHSKITKKLSVRHIHLIKEKYTPSADPELVIRYLTGSPIKDNYFMDIIRYDYENKRTIYPFNFYVEAEYMQRKDTELNDYSRYIKLVGAAEILLQYRKSNKGLTARLFAGGFPYNKTLGLIDYSYRLKPSGSRGENDYRFEHLMMGRLEFDGILAQQVTLDDGALHTRTDKISNDLGSTFKYIYALNLKFDFPSKIPVIPIKKLPFFGYINLAKSGEMEFVERTPSQTKTHLFDLAELGLGIQLVKNSVEVYFPIMYNKKLKDAVNSSTDKYYQKITFLLNLNNLNLLKRGRNAKLE